MQILLPVIHQMSKFYTFQQDSAIHAIQLICRQGRLQTSFTTKQPSLKCSGLQSVVINAGEGLQRADQGRILTPCDKLEAHG